ncbi:MAG TPA: DUF6457 domain-containing protein [Actinomycetota bacterium]|nr:DUF6457 domain-containing protein [Actinomycetota bacterium]
MDRWLDELAEALGVEPLEAGESGDLLRSSRDVAHGVERRFAPLASFLLGVATERGTAAGASRAEAFAAAVERLRWTLPPPDEPAESSDAPTPPPASGGTPAAPGATPGVPDGTPSGE